MPDLLLKLIEIELSMSGLSIRKGILNKIENIFKMDWGSLDEINSRKLTPERKNVYKDKLDSLKRRYEEISR